MPARSAPQPMSAMNITPLIDVLLVLLIMFIMTIPGVTHKLGIDLPSGAASTQPISKPHLLAIGASGALTLDGTAVSEGALPARLAPIADDPTGVLTIDTADTARYETFDRVLATIHHAGITRLGFANNGRFAGGGDF
jgi:biopolymer transport protein ExbD